LILVIYENTNRNTKFTKSIFWVGYVEEIRRDLLNLTKEELKSVAERYNSKVPQPLNSQFPDRVKKSTAVDQYTQRKERETTNLYPAGEVIINNK